MPAPVNDTQVQFAALCKAGGGLKGGPIRSKVLDLIRRSGQKLNLLAYQEVAEHFAAHPSSNPWHVCFGLGLCWGHLARPEIGFTTAVVEVLSNWNGVDLSTACSYHLERGPEPIEKSLIGAQVLFQKVTLPPTLPTTLERLNTAQQRWLSPILHPTKRPPYIGSWNATAMFMVALFAQPALAKTQLKPEPLLPPGGPVYNGLRMLHETKVSARAPSGSSLDDAAFEPGALYENNALLVELLAGMPGACLADIHSGVYMLGTRDPKSAAWT